MHKVIDVDIALPVLISCLIVLANVCIFKLGNEHRTDVGQDGFKGEAPFRRAERFVVEHYVAILIDCMLLLPLLVQVVYSIPLCSAKISAESVLSFWGVALGIVGAAFSYQKQKSFEREKRREMVAPNFQVTLNRDIADDTYALTLVNHKAFKYQITKICNEEKNICLSENGRLILKIDQHDFTQSNEEFKQRLEASGIDASKEPAAVSLEVFDPDGTKWLLDYKWAGSRKWIESFRFFIDSN